MQHLQRGDTKIIKFGSKSVWGGHILFLRGKKNPCPLDPHQIMLMIIIANERLHLILRTDHEIIDL